ncbi:hypothetical protein, partial [Escherichia coli]|uniref:hypothetical protein n=1 Tax=Escherichia coli TaxID=562 RepID=UPI00142E4EAB
MEEPLKPSIKQLAEWFINGLEPVCHAAVNTRNVKTEEDFETVIAEAKIAERRAQQKEGEKSRRKSQESRKR